MSRNRRGGFLDGIGSITDPCDRDLLLFFYRHPRTVLTIERLALYVGYQPSHVATSLDALMMRGLVTCVPGSTTTPALMSVLTVDGQGHRRPGDTLRDRPASRDGMATISPLDAVFQVSRTRRLCVPCIARAAHTTRVRVLDALVEIRRKAAITQDFGPCSECGAVGDTYATLAATARPADLSGIGILVVDDHEETMDLYAAVLEQAGAIVQRATNLLEALNLFQQVEIDVVVTDIAMPGGSGWDVFRELRMRSPGVPVVAVTGQLVPGGRELVDRGFAAALLKPIDPAHLVAVVGHLIGHERPA